MISSYVHDVTSGVLVLKRVDGEVVESNPFAYFRLTLAEHARTTVVEGHDAEREMFNHFGDDSSWPQGWWERLADASTLDMYGLCAMPQQ